MTQETLILTGMSGAGRSTVAHALEDLGWYVVDNLPPSLLPALVSKAAGPQGKELAVVVDVRGGEFFDERRAIRIIGLFSWMRLINHLCNVLNQLVVHIRCKVLIALLMALRESERS
jgi:dephospho-CoA kinase